MSTTQPISEIRAQIYFPRDLYRVVKESAKQQDISFAEAIRRAAEKEYKKKRMLSQKERDKAWEEFFKLSGIIKSGPKDISLNHDKYLADALWEEHLRTEKEYAIYKRKQKKDKHS